MVRRTIFRALILAVLASAFFFTGCATTETRIADHPDMFNNLSPNDQALVRQGQIRAGMSQNAVWLAWGSPDQKAVGNMRGHSTETWIYVNYTYGYPYGYPYHYPYYGGFGLGFVGVTHVHRHHNFVFFGDPFYDPFYYSYIPPSIPYPYKTVTFSNGRVRSFQYLLNYY
jgi:hypothetical protein